MSENIEFEKYISNLKTPALCGPEIDFCDNCGENIDLETYDSFVLGYETCVADIIEYLKKEKKRSK